MGGKQQPRRRELITQTSSPEKYDVLTKESVTVKIGVVKVSMKPPIRFLELIEFSMFVLRAREEATGCYFLSRL